MHCISCHVNQEPHLVYCICQLVYCICHHVHVHQEPHLGVLYLPAGALDLQFTVKSTAEAIMYIRSNTVVYYISHQVYCGSHGVLQEPHLDVLHILSCKSGAPLGALYLPIGVLHMPSCTCASGASLGCTVFVSRYTGFTIYHQVYCRGHHVHQEPHLGVLHLPSSVLHMSSSNIRSNTGVYYISHQVYCRGHAVLQEPYLGVLLLPSSVL